MATTTTRYNGNRDREAYGRLWQIPQNIKLS